MFITEKYSFNPLSFLPLPSKASTDSNLLSSLRAFDDALAARLASLLPIPETSLPLSWLARAVDLLALTLSDASALLSHPAAGDSTAVAAILDSTAALLDACNALAARAERLLRCRLLARFALHLLLSRPNSSLPRARETLAQWDTTPSSPAAAAAAQIHESLAPRDLPSKVSGARRAIYGVEALSSLVAGAALAALTGKGGKPARIRISGEFPWAEDFEKVAGAVGGKLGEGFAFEIEAAEAAVRKLVAVINEETEEEEDGEKTETLRSASKEAEKATEEMKEGLCRLTGAVNGLFRVTLAARNAALQSLRVGPDKRKSMK